MAGGLAVCWPAKRLEFCSLMTFCGVVFDKVLLVDLSLTELSVAETQSTLFPLF